jgi:hypothetical protein
MLTQGHEAILVKQMTNSFSRFLLEKLIVSHSSSQGIPRQLWNQKFRSCVHKIPPLVTILSQMNTVHNFPCYFSILILSSHLCLRLPSSLFPSGFPNNNFYACPMSLIRATCPVHLILLNLITLIIFDEAYGLWSLLQSPATSFLLGPNFPLSVLFADIHSLFYSVLHKFHVSDLSLLFTRLMGCACRMNLNVILLLYAHNSSSFGLIT